MDLKAALLQKHSKQQTLRIANYIETDQKRFDALMDLFYKDEYRVVQRAAWVVSHYAEKYLFLFKKHLPKMVNYMVDEKAHKAVRRNIVRTFTLMEVPESLMGIVADTCFAFLVDPKEAVAVKVYAMEVLYQFYLKEPDLGNELKLLEFSLEGVFNDNNPEILAYRSFYNIGSVDQNDGFASKNSIHVVA